MSLMMGNAVYTGTGTYGVVFPDRIKNVTKGETIIAPLHKIKELIDTGNFTPDEETNKELEMMNGTTPIIIDGMLKGKRCFILGGGGSLTGFDFSLLDNEFSIAINHTVIYYPKASANIFLDGDYLDKNNSEARMFLKTYKGLIFCSHRTTYQRENPKAIPFYNNLEAITRSFSRGLYGTRLTGIAALSLAIVMQAEMIYLLGFDLDTSAERVHFYDNGKEKYHNEDGYKGARVAGHINEFKKFDHYKDKIINCNLNSKIPYFKFKPIEEVL